MIAAITSTLTTFISWLATVLDAIIGTTGDLNALMPLLAIGICGSILFIVVKLIRKITWGA